MKSVSSILKVYSKTIKDLTTRKSQIEKEEEVLYDRLVAIDKVLKEATEEKMQAEIAIDYLGGLFNAINKPKVSNDS